MDKNVLRNVGVALVLMVLFSFVLVSLPTRRVMATPAAITSLSPSSGSVGDRIMLNGTIDTPDGFFTVRWNHTLNVTMGQASGFNVATSLVVPQTVGAPSPSGRNITVELIDNAAPAIIPYANFTLFTRLTMSVGTPTAPKQLQEGSTIPIAVNVTGGESNTVYMANITVTNPANQIHSIFPSFSNTTTIGFGQSVKTYPSDFVGAHTNYTGKYVVALNGTISQEFRVGLTDSLEYRRNETVQIQATGYSSLGVVTVNIKTGSTSVSDFPKNITASAGGVVTLSWKVPLNATAGTYSLSIVNSTSGATVKPVPDAQDFEVLGVLCRIQTENLAGEGVANVLVEVYNSTTQALLTEGNTNSTGWIGFNVDEGNYTFKSFYKDVQVGNLTNQNITADVILLMSLRLVNLVATVETEAGGGVPSIGISVEFNYTTRENITISDTASAQTNLTGTATVRNLFTNITYLVEATRFGMLFNSTVFPVKFSPSLPLSLVLTLPTYRLNVHAVDSQNEPADGFQIRVYEWASGVTTHIQTSETDSNGDTSFLLPFGRYRLRVFNDDIFLNESVVNLNENPVTLSLLLITANVEVTVSTLDYFGQPISNAEVKIERIVNEEYVLADSKFTGTGGSTVFDLPVAGDSRISVYVAGRLTAIKTQFLGGTSQVTFNIGEYVSIFGYPVETGLFALSSFLLLLVVVFLFLVRRRLMKVFGKTLKR